MQYKLYSEYITLQALLKELSLIPSGGAIKGFLAEHVVLFNNEVETRRGKKIRLGDMITLPEQDLTITIIEPTPEEQEQHLVEIEEKKRVAQMVKEINQQQKGKTKKNAQTPAKVTKRMRFPGVN
ncbi:S4 domain-containing protein YaaA [Streptococcus halichoeri]|uniref:S4 domain-containing protein YaaA n=1 Tax=Streptococcus halichoeri TaxID=254785 RepID=UPI0013576AB0|nr:S4 domain-containing protein YaaA [Streptococcus halichoeri]